MTTNSKPMPPGDDSEESARRINAAIRAKQWERQESTSEPYEGKRTTFEELVRTMIDLNAELRQRLVRISALVAEYQNQGEEGWPAGPVMPRKVIAGIADILGPECSVCRRRHGSEVRHGG